VVVTDPFADLGSIVRGTDVSGDNDNLLEVGETWGFTAAHTVTQAEIDSNGGGDGFLENTATADSDQTGPDTDDASVPVGPSPGIALIKTGEFQDENGDGDADVGETIEYAFAVTNTGNVTLTNVTVTDPKVTVVGGPTTLDIGETDNVTFTGTYVLTQEDIDAEQVDNTATADSDETDPTDDDETVTFVDDAPLVGELGKSVDEDFLAAGNQDLPIPSPGDDGGADSVTDDFPIDFGSDFDGAEISFADLHGTAVTDASANPVTTSDGDLPLTYFWDEATNTLYGSTDATDATTAAATAAFTLQVTNPDSVNEAGSFTFTLQQALEHGQTGTPNTENPNIILDLDYLATDADGDEAPGTLGITIDDDIPIRAADATPITTSVEEDGMSTTAVVPEGLNGPDQSDGNKEAGDSNDDDQKSSLVAGSLAALVAVGADAPGAFGLDSDTSSLPELSSKGEAVTYDTSDTDADGIDDTLVATAGGRTVFTLKVNTDGTWEFDLDDQLDHVDDGADDENVDLVTTGASVPAIDFSSIIQVTDADGDTVNVLLADDFTIAVEDDIPELTDAEDLSVENVVGSAGTASGEATFSVGADEAVSFVITEATGEEGVDYTISPDGQTVTGHMDLDGDGNIEPGEDLYTFTINDDGEYTFTLLAPLPEPDPIPFSAAGIKSGDYDNLTLSNSGLQLVIDAETATGADTTLQVSQASGGGLGVGQNTVEQEESVTFSFEKADGTDAPASSFTVLFKADAGDPDYVWTATLEDGTTVTLDDGGADNSGGADVTYTAVGSGDRIATVELASGEKFTDVQLQIVGDQNDKVKLGLEGFSFTPATPDLNLAFDIEATDADGDTAILQLADSDTDGDLDSLQVHIEADGDPTTLADAAMQTYLQSLSSSV
jgi:T1SS-143 domain-containing protein